MPTTCTPQSLYGPYHQTRFCGASIMSFSVSAGWNEQSSELTVELVVDCSTSNQRIEYDTNLEASIVTDADEFSEPHIGSAAYFRVGDKITDAGEYERNPEGGFEFTGIIQSWNKKEDTSGNPAYSLKLTDPRIILDSSHIIVSDLAEAVDVVRPDTDRRFSTPNIINAYAWLESLDMDCRNAFDLTQQTYPTVIDGTNIGSLTGGFGGAGVNERGMRWNLLKQALAILVSTDQVPYASSGGFPLRTTSTEPYSPYGRLIYRGGGNKTSSSSGKVLLPGSGVLGPSPLDGTGRYLRYMVDLSEIPFAPNYYRITGPTISFSELISQVCAAAGCDYYVELLPVKGLGGLNLVIKVRVVIRSSQPKLGEIQTFVNDQDFVVSKTFGQELATQPNSIFIFGAKRQDYLEQPKDGALGLTANLNIIPSAGFNTEGTPQIVTYGSKYGGSAQWWWYLDARRINMSLYNSIGSNYIWVSEGELQFALGTPDIWKNWEITRGGALGTIGTWLRSIGITVPTVLPNPKQALGKLDNAVVTESTARNPTSYAAKDALTVFQWLSAFANEYYGKKFLVKVPGVCRDYDYGTTTAPPYYSDYPADDGAWSDDASVLGLLNPSAYMDFFKGPDGKIQTILKFYLNETGKRLNLEALNAAEYIASSTGGNTAWVKGDVDPKWMVGYPFALESTEHAWAQVSISNIVTKVTLNQVIQQQRAPWSVAGQGENSTGASTVAGVSTANDSSRWLKRANVGFVSDPAPLPVYAGIPLKSHSRCYGPWGNIATASFDNDLFNPEEEVVGLLTVEQDEELAPWGYGSTTLMDYAAQDKVKLAVTEMQISERGQVTIPGYPNKRVGSSLNTTDTSSYDMALIPDQYGSFVYFKIDLGDAQKGGASISNVNINISPQGVQTELSLSTFSPTFGRFARSNADRLKRVGRDRLAANRKMRANMALKASFFRGGGANAFDRAKAMGGGTQPQSTTIWFCGRYAYDVGGSVTNTKEVVANDAAAQSYFGANYDNTSIMTMDGLLRPVSKAGDGSLPQYASYANHCGGDGNGYSVLPGPPQSGITPISINIDDLDPLANPTTVDADSVSQRAVGGSDFGHDWEGVARDDVAGISVQTGSLGFDGPVGYTSDYRFLALRGPLMLQSWGYDLQGFPVPNSADSSQQPNTNYENLTNSFQGNWLQSPRNWPVAPVDLRFDRRRGVWTTPPAFGMYLATVKGEIAANGGPGRALINDGNTDDPEGPGSIDNLYNKGNSALSDGDKVFAYYDTHGCNYWAIPTAGGSGGGLSLQDRAYCEYTPSEAVGAGGACSDTSCLVFGWGLQADYDPTGTEISAPFYIGSRSESNRTDLLGVGDGLATEQGDDTCEKVLTLSMACSNNTYCPDPTEYECPSTGVRMFQWGPGLETHGVAGSPNMINVRKTLTVGADRNSTAKGKYISTIGLGCGLKVEAGNTCGADQATQSTSCSIEVDITAPYSEEAHEIEVMCGIKCDSDGIEAVSKFLVFSDCGLFMGTKQSNGRGQSIGALDTTREGVACEESSSSRTTTNIATFAS